MRKLMTGNSEAINELGVVETRNIKISLPQDGLRLQKGGILHDLSIAYETYGALNPAGDNVVYICTALTGDAHAAGYHGRVGENPGWWNQMIGPGKGIDTDFYYVVCANILGGCRGTTGPSSINPATGKPHGSAFPEITVTDIVNVQKMLLDHLGVKKLAAVIGGSFGGMQVIEWSIRYPEFVERCVCVAAGVSLSSQALAFDVVARDAITSDPRWVGGDYYGTGSGPDWGLSHARKIGHITYLSHEIMQEKFGRERAKEDAVTGGGHFQVENYLNYQGRKFIERFDANTYLQITMAMDNYDLAEEFGSLEAAFRDIKSKFLVVALSSDWLFPPEESFQLANALMKAGKKVSFCTLEAPYGHDAFLIDIAHLSDTVRAFLPWVGRGMDDDVNKIATREFNIIAGKVKKGARVLDLGCGEGKLLTVLSALKEADGLGVDVDLQNVISVINRGHEVYQGNLDEDMSIFPDHSYDYAVLSSTIQQVGNPRTVLREMIRIAREGIVTFPNFANWRNRFTFGFLGKMPKNEAFPYEWYNTPNIHLATRNDFVELCRNEGIKILELVCLPGNSWFDRVLVAAGWCNMGAERVIARIRKAEHGEAPGLPVRCGKY